MYRPAIVLGDSETGEIDKIDGPYYFFTLIKRMRDYLPGFLPPVPAPGFTMTNVVPVDYVAKAMDALRTSPGWTTARSTWSTRRRSATSTILECSPRRRSRRTSR